MQILVNKTYQLTLFEVPKIAVNTIEFRNALQTDELEKINESFKKKNFHPTFKSEIVDIYSKHEDLTLTFKDLCVLSLEETMTFFLS